jgi:transposase
MAKFRLTEEQRRLLRAQLCSAEDVDLYRRTLALLQVDEGRSPAEVSRSLGVGSSSVYNWLNAFARSPQPNVLFDRRGQGRPSLWTDPLDKLLRDALRQSPDVWGYRGGNWTVPLLQTHLGRQGGIRISAPTIRRKLRQWGYAWNSSRYMLVEGPELKQGAVDSVADKPAALASGCQTAMQRQTAAVRLCSG